MTGIDLNALSAAYGGEFVVLGRIPGPRDGHLVDALPVVDDAPTGPLTFDEHLRQVTEHRAAMIARHGEAVSAAEADIRDGIGGMFVRVLRKEQAAARDKLGEGTPLDELVLSDEERAYFDRFFDTAGDAPRQTWNFYTMVDVTPALAPRPTRPEEPSLEGLSWGDKRKARAAHEAAVAAYEAEMRQPVVEPARQEKRVEIQELRGWRLGYATRQDMTYTRRGKMVWSSLQGTPPEEYVVGEDQKLYCITTGISNLDNTLVANRKDNRPTGVPLDEHGRPMRPELGEFGPVRRMTVEHEGQTRTVLFAEFTPYGESLGERLVTVAAEHNFRPATEAVSDKVVAEAGPRSGGAVVELDDELADELVA